MKNELNVPSPGEAVDGVRVLQHLVLELPLPAESFTAIAARHGWQPIAESVIQTDLPFGPGRLVMHHLGGDVAGFLIPLTMQQTPSAATDLWLSDVFASLVDTFATEWGKPSGAERGASPMVRWRGHFGVAVLAQSPRGVLLSLYCSVGYDELYELGLVR